MANLRWKRFSVLAMSTLAFTVCFAVWVIFSILGITVKKNLDLSDTQFGLLAATPILSGALSRLPLGMLADKYGGRVVFFVLMLSIVPPLWLLGEASRYWHFLVLGLFVGLAGGSFAVGISYTARWFERERQGLVMGIFGAGNAGAALTTFIAPTLIVFFGWQMLPRIYAVAVLLTALAFWFFTYSDIGLKTVTPLSLRQQLATLRDPRVWRYCQYYSIVFGGYVGLSLWLPKYYISEYGFGFQQAALIATAFVLPAGLLRAVGGWLADRFGAHTVTWWVMWVSWVALFIISYPQTEVSIRTVHGGSLMLHFGLNPWSFTLLVFVIGIAWGFGSASVFKYVAQDYPDRLGMISGLVGLIGALGGFLLPIFFGLLVDSTGVNSSIFMLLYGITCVSLIWMHWAFKKENGHAKARVAAKSADMGAVLTGRS